MEVSVKGDKVTITFPLSQPRPSYSGKTNVVYSTGGFQDLHGDMRINLTVIQPR